MTRTIMKIAVPDDKDKSNAHKEAATYNQTNLFPINLTVFIFKTTRRFITWDYIVNPVNCAVLMKCQFLSKSTKRRLGLKKT